METDIDDYLKSNDALHQTESAQGHLLHPDETIAIDAKKYFEYFTIPSLETTSINKDVNSIASLQQIFYGAPGTGKSNTIKCDVDKKDEMNRVLDTLKIECDKMTEIVI